MAETKKRSVAEVVEIMRIEVGKWQAQLRKSAEGQDQVYTKVVDDAIRVSDGLMALIDSLGVQEAWMQLALLHGLQCVCSGQEFTNTMSGLLHAVRQGKQILVFDSTEEVAALMGRAAGRG